MAKFRSMITPAQCRAARALVKMTTKELSTRTRVAGSTINRFEQELTKPIHSTLKLLQQALEAAGVEFTNGRQPGVRMKSKDV